MLLDSNRLNDRSKLTEPKILQEGIKGSISYRELLIFGGMGIIKGPFLERDIITDAVDWQAVC